MARGPGRPRIYGERVDLSLRVEPSLREDLSTLAELKGQSMNEVAVNALDKFVERALQRKTKKA